MSVIFEQFLQVLIHAEKKVDKTAHIPTENLQTRSFPSQNIIEIHLLTFT